MNIKDLENKHNGEHCFLLGSGPSLNDYDLSKLNDETLIVASYFYLHKNYRNFNNLYYCFTSRYPCRNGVLPEGFFRKSMRNRNAKFFFDRCFEDINIARNYYPSDRIYFMELDRNRGYLKDGEELVTDVSKPTTRCGTIVADIMLPLTYYMGFKTVYVIGCDCTKTKPNQVPPHFYKNEQMPQSVYNVVKQFTSGFNIEELNLAWDEWRKKFESDNRHIYNLNPKGNLNVLERKDYDEVLDEISNNNS